METRAPATGLQPAERIVMAVARAMCGHARPCRYHIANARLAIPAYREALGTDVLDLPVVRIVGDDATVLIPHEGIVR